MLIVILKVIGALVLLDLVLIALNRYQEHRELKAIRDKYLNR